MNAYFKSIIDSDSAPVVICDLNHMVVYMNPASIEYYKCNIVGKSIKVCHNNESNEKIDRVVEWFKKSPCNNKVFTYHSESQNKDVYMIALRDGEKLIGYYEKHEYRNAERGSLYNIQ